MRAHVPSLLLLLVVLLIGCGGADDGSSSISPEARAEAAKIFESRCVTCHGPLGKGDGPGSAGLTPAPKDLTEKRWQKSVTDEHIERIIQFGGSGVEMSPVMPANPDLMSKPEVVTALRIQVRQLAGK